MTEEEKQKLDAAWEGVKLIHEVLTAQGKINESLNRDRAALEVRLDRMVRVFADQFKTDFWMGLDKKIIAAWEGKDE